MEGQRVRKSSGGGKKALIVTGAVAGVLAAAYLGLCIWIGSWGAIFPNVAVGELDLSGLTMEQAQQTLSGALAQHRGQVSAQLTYKDWTSQPLAGDAVQLNGYVSAERAWHAGRTSFIARGFQLLRHLLGAGTQVELELALSGTGNSQLEELLDRAEEAVGGSMTDASYEVGADTLSMTKGVTGVALHREQAGQDLLPVLKQAYLAAISTAAVQPTVSVPLTAAETPPQAPDFAAIHQAVAVEPKNAQVDPETYEISDHVVGVDFDVNGLQQAYEQAGEGETFTVPLELIQPEETRESLEGKLFRDLLGQAGSSVTGNANRRHNVKLSAALCSGIVLMPGEEFSYLGAIGQCTAEAGYRSASVYVGGKTVDEMGGGVCQTSSTLYWALLRTELEVVERRNHQFAVGYVPDGMDATVYHGVVDFRFRNSLEYPVKVVVESVESGNTLTITAKLYGTNVTGRYGVAESHVYDVIQPTTTYVANAAIPRGTTQVDQQQNPYRGRTAQTYRYIYEADGTLVSRQDMGVSRYKMRPTTIYYNPLDGDPAAWVDGKPPAPEPEPAPAPEPAPDPGTAPDPGVTTDPGQANEPWYTPDPGPGTDPWQAPGSEQTTGPLQVIDPGQIQDPGQGA